MQVRQSKRHWKGWKELAVVLGVGCFLGMTAQQVKAAGDRVAPSAKPIRVSNEAAVQAVPLQAAGASESQTSPRGESVDQAVAVWLVLEHHRQGDVEAAELAWQELTLPPESEIWRDLGLAMTALMQGKLNAMESHLVLADLRHPDHPLVQYLWGVYHVTRSDGPPLNQVAKRAATGQVQLATGERDCEAALSSYPRHRHLLSAVNHLQRAIELGPTLALDEAIVQLPAPVSPTVAYEVDAPYRLVLPATAPTVAEYLEAIGCHHYVARAHAGLAGLHRELGDLHEAEDHLEAASLAGLTVEDEWLALAAEYESLEQHEDAARVYLKAASHGHQVAKPLREAWRNVREAFR